MKTFYFDTGVRFADFPTLYGRQVNRGGNKQIPFDVSDTVPDNAALLFLCDNPELPDAKRHDVLVELVFNTDVVSKYAYFRVYPTKGA